MSAFGTYLIGFLILIGGLAYAAYLLNVPSRWVVVGVIVLVGAGVVSATRHTRMRDASDQASNRTNRTPPTTPTT